MSALVDLEQALLLHRAEDRWLRQCADRLRSAARPDRDRRGSPRGAGGRPMSAVLHLDRVTRIHGSGATEVHALRAVTFRAHAGELVAVMGPSGSGKSTLLTLAGGLDEPTDGTVLVEGVDLATLGNTGRARMRRTSIGYVFQDFNLIPALTAAENVALPRELDGVRSRTARAQAVTALEEVGLADLADRFPDEMSGGQQQRVAIARAIVGERRLILADEPTGALDTDTGEEVLRLLRARCDAGAAGVLVTHEARHAAWADRVVFLRDGIVVDESGSDAPEALLEPGLTT
jgi:putative ABC transport system ATP-binding protein